MMSTRLVLSAVIATLLSSDFCLAQTVIVNETFDSYTDTFDLGTVWKPDAGDGEMQIGEAGQLIPNSNTLDFPNGANNPPGIQGQGVGNFGSINEYNGSPYALLPSATQNIVVRGDIYVFDDGSVVTDEASPVFGLPLNNTRQTIGLRNDTKDRDPTFGIQRGLNFLEMGFYNDTSCDPTVAGCDTASSLTREQRQANPGFRESTQFAYRIVIFGGYGDFSENGVNKGPLEAAAPNWQYFQLDPALDLSTTVLPNGNSGNGDGMVNITDVGSGWHTFQATLSADSMLLELDLFRDGINNATGAPGVDASAEIGIVYATAPEIPGQQEAGDAPFTSFRIGGPSGIGSTTLDLSETQPSVFDNLYLALEDVATGVDGDFDGDGDVDGVDFLVWQRGESPDPLSASDLADWQANYGAPNTISGNVTSVPEPSTNLFVVVLMTTLVSRKLWTTS